MQSQPNEELKATHDAQQQRFFIDASGHRCVADYQLQDGVMKMTYTGVHPSLRGHGIAAILVAAALDHAREHRLRVDPVCSYVRVYMDRHPETNDLRA